MATLKNNVHDIVIEDNNRAVGVVHYIEVEYMSMAQRYIITIAGKSLYGFCL